MLNIPRLQHRISRTQVLPSERQGTVSFFGNISSSTFPPYKLSRGRPLLHLVYVFACLLIFLSACVRKFSCLGCTMRFFSFYAEKFHCDFMEANFLSKGSGCIKKKILQYILVLSRQRTLWILYYLWDLNEHNYSTY